VIFLAGLTILRKVRCLGRLSGWGGDPVVALHLNNAADYRLPTFGPHGTKLVYSGFQWKIKSDFSGWFDNSEKGEVSVQNEWIGGWSRGCTPPKECCRLPPSYFWTTWHQTRAFSISVKNEKWSFWLVWQRWKRRCVWALLMDVRLIPWLHSAARNAADYRLPSFGSHGTKLGHSWFQWKMNSNFSGWFDNSEKGDMFGHIEWMWGWSRCCTPPQECCRLPPTYFWTTWHQTRAFLIAVKI